MRLQPPDPTSMSEKQTEVYQAIASGPRGRVRGPLAVWLHRPELAEAAQALGSYCRYSSSLEPHLSELAILTTAQIWQSEFEWWAHKPPAIKSGLSLDVIEALRRGEKPDFDDPMAGAVFEVVRELNATRALGDQLYERALSILGRDRLVDLIGLCGYYTLISMTINAFDIGLPAGETNELTERHRPTE
ncbi:carboxymuconolactone decarboxylase family protein [Pelagibacterium limicola]|uniref:carboxymuconolactone decarboxylase family protein n=1 Tax=Pelagibacterium limicola TaxID=2791022 RepID=UPI0018AFD73F|nr:carboxymuconolactone decarboxylase family protein [Pelagibacterium limicola]